MDGESCRGQQKGNEKVRVMGTRVLSGGAGEPANFFVQVDASLSTREACLSLISPSPFRFAVWHLPLVLHTGKRNKPHIGLSSLVPTGEVS